MRVMVLSPIFLLCFVFGAKAQTLAGDPPLFIRMSAKSPSYVQAPLKINIRIGVERNFLENNLIQLFRRKLDIPLQVEAAWLERLSGAMVLDWRPGEKSMVANQTLIRAAPIQEVTIKGRAFAMFEIQKTFLPLRPGSLTFTRPRLNYAFAQKFQDSLVSGRMALDRQDATMWGEPLSINILPLPVEGRPLEFMDAVGRFTLEAEAFPLEMTVGDSLKLKLKIQGEGNLAFFTPPLLSYLKDFHVFGWKEEKSPNLRVITYDLAPMNEEVTETPPLVFSFFDPNPPVAYRTVRTQPIPIQVNPLPQGARLELLAGVPGKSDIYGLKPITPNKKQELSNVVLILGLLFPWLLGIWFYFYLKALERDRRDPDGVRARKAKKMFLKQIKTPDPDLCSAFTEFLTARLRSPAPTAIDPDLLLRLKEAGIPKDLALRSKALLDDLICARYGGLKTRCNRETAKELVLGLETYFSGRAAC